MGGQERDRRECVGKYITAQKGGIIAKVFGGGGAERLDENERREVRRTDCCK